MLKYFQNGFAFFILIAGVFALLFFYSPLLNGFNGAFHIDSQVYLYSGLQLLNGKILYKELFDHKGPIMHLIEMVGLLISPNKTTYGVWIVQYILLLGSFAPLFFYWTKKLSPFVALSSGLILISWIYRFMTIGDNIPELYSVAFVTLSIYFSFQILFEQNNIRRNAICLGITSSMLIMIKLNFVIIVFPMLIWILIDSHKNKKHLSTFLNFTIGSMIVLLPIIIYFYLNNALAYAFEAIWTFNFSYIKSNALTWWQSIHEVFFKQKNYFLWICLLIIPLKLLFAIKNKTEGLVLFSTVCFSILILVAMPGRGNESRHYLIPLAPIFAWMVVWLVQDVKPFFEYVLLISCLYFIKPMIIDSINQHNKFASFDSCSDFILKHKKDQESLLVIGNHSSAYWQLQMNSPFRFFYTYPILQHCENKLTQSFVSAFQANRPTWLYIEKQYSHPSCILKLVDHYQLKFQNERCKVYYLQSH